MKKIIMTLALISGIATAFGQGYINFGNTSGSQNVSTNNALDIFGNSSGGSGSGLVSGSSAAPQGYYYTILMLPYASGPTVAASTLSDLFENDWLSGWTGAYATNALGAGRLGGGNDAPTLQNDVAGNGNQFIVVGWSSSLGSGNGWMSVSNLLSSLYNGGSSAVAGFLGWSTVGTGTGAGNPPATAETIFGGATGIQSPFTLYAVPVPEPTTIALAGLGGLSLLLFRRRKV